MGLLFDVSFIIPATLPGLCFDWLGGLLRPVTKLSGRAFSFHCLSVSLYFLSQTHIHPFLCLSSIHPSPSCDILSQAQIPVSFSLSSSIHPATRLPPSIFLSSLNSAFLCSVLTLSSLPHVLLQAYSVPDADFYCHSVYTGTLWVKASVTTSTVQASVRLRVWLTGIFSASELMPRICSARLLLATSSLTILYIYINISFLLVSVRFECLGRYLQ